jgi:hypothetical protein
MIGEITKNKRSKTGKKEKEKNCINGEKKVQREEGKGKEGVRDEKVK